MNRLLSHALMPILALALLSRTGAPPVARAATVDYSSGTSYFVIGNPTSSGGVIGIGGTSVLPADNANASGNSVNVTDGTVNTGIYGGHHKATTGSAGADSNRVTISNFAGGSALLIWGGDADASEYVAGNTSSASGNSVTVSGGTFGSVHGGNSQSYNGPASADGNTVRVTGVTVDDISGGLAMVNMGGSTATATSNNNEVIVTDSAVTYSVYGGSVVYDSARSFVSNGNRITLSGNTSVGGGVYGGALLHDTNNYNGSTGNTLNIVNPGSGGITVSGGVKYFQHYNFYLPSSMTAGGTMLRVGGTACVNGATVNVGIDGASSPLRAGDTVTLIDAGTLDGTPANSTADGQGMQGVTLRYQFDISTAANRLLATVSGAPAVNEQTKALSEGYLSGMALVNQGADLIAGQGMDSAVKAARSGSERGYGLATFGALSGGSLRYNTGSHVDVRSLSLLTGLSFGAELAPGRMTLGAFFEYGNGSYDTYNSFSNAASVHGDGNMYHIGGGVLGRMDFADTGPGHFYAEASGRMGNAHNEYDSSDLRDARGRKADYDSSFAYYGLHFGTGYVWNINDRASLDLYGKYFWTRQEGDSLRLSTGDPVRFKASDSNRLRFGSRFGYAVNEYLSPYIGAAWEHEFDGKARATTNGHDIDAPSLRGDTGMGELGLTLTPSSSLPLVFDLGVQGYVGKREGVTGSLQVRFDF